MTPAALQITKARIALIRSQPFFGTLALRLQPQEDPAAPTAWTDGRTLGYNPEFILSLTVDQLRGLICHEVMHIANLHHLRKGEREHKRWNVAADFAINPLIINAGMELPPGGLNNPAYNDQSAEHIYNLLPPDQGGDGSEGPGEVRPFPGGAAEQALEEQQTKIAVQQAAQMAKAQGKLPGSLARLIEELGECKVDWKEALHRFVSQSARNDYTFKRPNKRYISTGFYLPSLYSEELPPLVVAIDTSGSVDAKMLAAFGGELEGILQQYPTELTVIYCDAKVNHVDTFSRDTPVKLHPHGGGGTDFRPVFDYVEKQGLEPCCLIYLTDLMGTFPQEPAPYPVLWITDERTQAPWGETIRR